MCGTEFVLDEWGPDAKDLPMGEAELEIKQHTECLGEDSRAMLDVSVTRFDRLMETVGEWHGFDGTTDAAQFPECCISGKGCVPLP